MIVIVCCLAAPAVWGLCAYADARMCPCVVCKHAGYRGGCGDDL